MIRPKFISNHIYHIYNRGVEKRITFQNDRDYLRFTYNLFEFNDQSPTLNMNYYFNLQASKVESRKAERSPRKLLVELFAFCLLPNHFHLMVRQKIEGGITEFMRKLGTGYTNYFNKKYERVGPLFQGKFKAVLIKENSHYIFLPYYIHLNPLDLIEKNWRENKVKNIGKAIKFLENYRWSSYMDYIGKKNFPSITQREYILESFSHSTSSYKSDMIQWLRQSKVHEIKNLTLE